MRLLNYAIKTRPTVCSSFQHPYSIIALACVKFNTISCSLATQISTFDVQFADYYLSDLFALALLDTPPFLFFATESKVIKAEDSSDSTGFEQWRSAQELDIVGVTALDVDISENKLYWINSVEKVSAPSNVAMHVHVARF